MNKTRKKGVNQQEKSKERLVNYKELERNILYEISNEFEESHKKKDDKKR